MDMIKENLRGKRGVDPLGLPPGLKRIKDGGEQWIWVNRN